MSSKRLSTIRYHVLVSLVLGMTLAFACKGEDKKKGGGASGDATPSAKPSPGTSTGANPCLRLLDGTDPDHDHEEGGDEELSASPSPSASASPSSTGEGTGGAADDDGCAPPPTGTGTGPGTGSGGGNWNPGPGLEGCEADGKAWRAVVDGGPGQCGDELVTEFCCTEAAALKQFPQNAAKLAELFAVPKAAGLKLYHCSHSGTKWTWHWALYKDNSIKYRTQYLEDVTPAGGAAAGACTKVTSAELGIPQGAGTGDDDDDAPPEDLPDAIGDVSTSLEGLRDFAVSNEYINWKHPAASADKVPHGWMRAYHNDVLVASMAAGGTTHPKGAIAVRQAYQADGATVKGYGIFMKIKDGAGANTWLVYEVNDIAKPDVVTYGVGKSPCVTCHGTSMTDFIQKKLP